VADAINMALSSFKFDYHPHRVGSEIIYTPA